MWSIFSLLFIRTVGCLIINSQQFPSLYMTIGIQPTVSINASVVVYSPFEICNNPVDISQDVRGKFVIFGYNQKTPFQRCRTTRFAKILQSRGAFGILQVSDLHEGSPNYILSLTESQLKDRNSLVSNYDPTVTLVALQVSQFAFKLSHY